MNVKKLEKILEEQKQPKFRLAQIIKAVYEDGVLTFGEISNLPKSLREILDKEIKILPFEAEKILISKVKDSIKALLKLADGNLIETVLISPKPGDWSACVSSQVGCPLNCDFCATGQTGFKRNLTAEEITDQILFWKQYLKFQMINDKYPMKSLKIQKFPPKADQPMAEKIKNYDVKNVVYMGMGEPFLNWDEVKKSLEIIMDEKYFNLGSRSISVSTAGVPDGIEKLARDFPQINLAISLHFANDTVRKKFMPASNNYNLENLTNDLEKYFTKSNRKVFLEYILFNGLNDRQKDAQELIKFIKYFKKYYLIHVNLIKYNETQGNFKPSSSETVGKFKDYLSQNRISVTVRKSLGADIRGACGQLAG